MKSFESSNMSAAMELPCICANFVVDVIVVCLQRCVPRLEEEHLNAVWTKLGEFRHNCAVYGDSIDYRTIRRNNDAMENNEMET